MPLEREFCKLPVTFDAERVRAEIARIKPYRWIPQGGPRYLTLPLVSHHGLDTAHPAPPTWPSSNLDVCPYLRQVLAHFRSVLTDARVRRIEPEHACEAEHYDEHHAAFDRYRLHLPLLADAVLRCNGREARMRPGEIWAFDRLAAYGVSRAAEGRLVHISVETSGSSTLWGLIERAQEGAEPAHIEHRPGCDASVLTENTLASAVLPPSDVDGFLADLVARVRASGVRDHQAFQRAVAAIRRFQHDWRTCWSLLGPAPEGWTRYRALAAALMNEIALLPTGVCDLRPGLGRRLHDFLRTGAINPRMSPYDVERRVGPDDIHELVGRPLLRLAMDGTFRYWNPLRGELDTLDDDTVDLLRWFALPATAAEAASATGRPCDGATLAAVERLAQQHLVRPLAAFPGLPLPEAEPEPEPATARPVGYATDVALARVPITEVDLAPWPAAHPLRLSREAHFRLAGDRHVAHLWVPRLQSFRPTPWRWLRLAALASVGVPAPEAAARAGVAYDGEMGAALASLIDHGVLAAASAMPARVRAGGR